MAGAWILYATLHSLLASQALKQRLIERWPPLQPAYRLLFNAVAIITLLPQLILSLVFHGGTVFSWPPQWQWLAHSLALLALAAFIWSLKFYDLQEFLGLKQWRNRHNPQRQGETVFVISPLHRFVRHPWYSLALVILWTREMDAMMLTSSIMISAYLFIGTHFEEKKLISTFGSRYREYCHHVPSLIPRPWRYLSTRKAQKLMI